LAQFLSDLKDLASLPSLGILLKSPGRLGHAAVFGAGCWSEQLNNGLKFACSVSGTGEAIIHCGFARRLRDRLSRSDPDVHEALSQILESITEHYSSAEAGVLLITSDVDGIDNPTKKNTKSLDTLFYHLRVLMALFSAHLVCIYDSSHGHSMDERWKSKDPNI